MYICEDCNNNLGPDDAREKFESKGVRVYTSKWVEHVRLLSSTCMFVNSVYYPVHSMHKNLCVQSHNICLCLHVCDQKTSD